MYAILGEIEFEVSGGIAAMSLSRSTDWAEHALIQGKPLLEYIGQGLDEYTLNIELHPQLGDPRLRQMQIAQAQAAHQPLALVLGSGDYLGAFVITEAQTEPRRTTADGQMHSASIALTLREYTGAFEPAPPRPAVIEASMAEFEPEIEPESGFEAFAREVRQGLSSVKTATEKALTFAHEANQVLQEAKEVVDIVKRGNPLALLAASPRVLDGVSQALRPLAGLANNAAQLARDMQETLDTVSDFASDVAQTVQSALEDAQSLVELGRDAVDTVQNITHSLEQVVQTTVVDVIESTSHSLGSVVGSFEAATAPMTRLAAKVATRRL